MSPRGWGKTTPACTRRSVLGCTRPAGYGALRTSRRVADVCSLSEQGIFHIANFLFCYNCSASLLDRKTYGGIDRLLREVFHKQYQVRNAAIEYFTAKPDELLHIVEAVLARRKGGSYSSIGDSHRIASLLSDVNVGRRIWQTKTAGAFLLPHAVFVSRSCSFVSCVCRTSHT